MDADNHALAALRYLISKLDARFIAKLRKRASADGGIETDTIDALSEEEKQDKIEQTQRSTLNIKPWLRNDNEALWDVK